MASLQGAVGPRKPLLWTDRHPAEEQPDRGFLDLQGDLPAGFHDQVRLPSRVLRHETAECGGIAQDTYRCRVQEPAGLPRPDRSFFLGPSQARDLERAAYAHYSRGPMRALSC